MLPYVLAIAIGLSSLILFLTAFLLPDIHRQDDFFWSAIGLFYALVLWFCATSITGGLLLGQVAAVALLTSYNWQTFKLRKAIAHPELQASLDSFSVVNSVKSLFAGKNKVKPQSPIPPTQTTPSIPTEEIDDTIIEETATPSFQTKQSALSEEPFAIEKTSDLQSSSTTTSTPPLTTKKPGVFGNLFKPGKKKPAFTPPESKKTDSITTTKLDSVLEEQEIETTSSDVVVTITQTTSTPESEITKIDKISITASEEDSPKVETEEFIVETTPNAFSSQSPPLTPAEIVDIIDPKIKSTTEETNWEDSDATNWADDESEPYLANSKTPQSETKVNPNSTTDSVQPKKALDNQANVNIDEFLEDINQKDPN